VSESGRTGSSTTTPALPALIKLRPRPDMRASVCEGLFGQIFVNIAGAWSAFVTALALSLGAGGRAFGLIFSAAAIVQLSQILGPMLLPLFGGSRRRLVVVSSAAARGIIFLLPAVILWFEPQAALALLIACFLVSQVFTGIMTNVWTGWIGAIVPERIRGRFLGKRVQLMTALGLVAAFAASILKDMSAPPKSDGGVAGFLRDVVGIAGGWWGAGGEKYAYVIIFTFAAAAGLASTLLLLRQRDRPAPTARFSLRSFAGPLRDSRFRRLVYFYGWWYFAASFGSPFFHPFMLKDLGMSLTAMQAYNSAFVIAMAATASLWGKLIDRFGNKPVLRGLVALAAANAFVYVFMEPGRYWWIWIEAVTSGAMWAGALVATTNFIIRLSPEGARDSYVAVYAVVAGACGLVGTIGSGLFVGALPPFVSLAGWRMLNFKVAFLLTAGLRLLSQLPISAVEEPRAVPFGRMMAAVAADVRLWFLRWRPAFWK
jgi:MFS family permease